MKEAVIIIPTCNRPMMLDKLVEQLRGQLSPKDEIILVNDGDEGSLSHISGPQITQVEHCKPYYAIASAQNAGMETALSLGYRWGVFIDDDCEVCEGWLDAHRNAWGDIETLYVGKQWDPRADEGEDIRGHWKYPDTGLPRKKDDISLGVLMMMALLNCSLHLPALKSLGGLDEDFDGEWGYEDTELSYRLLIKNDWNLKYLGGAELKNFRAPPGSNYSRDKSNNAEVLRDKLPDNLIRKCFDI